MPTSKSPESTGDGLAIAQELQALARRTLAYAGTLWNGDCSASSACQVPEHAEFARWSRLGRDLITDLAKLYDELPSVALDRVYRGGDVHPNLAARYSWPCRNGRCTECPSPYGLSCACAHHGAPPPDAEQAPAAAVEPTTPAHGAGSPQGGSR